MQRPRRRPRRSRSQRPASRAIAEVDGVKGLAWVAALSLLLVARADAQRATSNVNWNAWGGDAGAQKYSALTEINRDNVTRLQIAWTWDAHEQPVTAAAGQ